MSRWVYFASGARAGEADTLEFAIKHKVVYRPAYTEDGGSLIANVRDLKPRDYILLTYRRAEPPRVKVIGRIAAPEDPVPGLRAIDRIKGDLAAEMNQKGYPLLEDGRQEVIRLQWAKRCDLELEGNYGGHNALHEVKPADQSAIWNLVRQAAE